MVLLFFVLDLRSLSPPLLEAVKQVRISMNYPLVHSFVSAQLFPCLFLSIIIVNRNPWICVLLWRAVVWFHQCLLQLANLYAVSAPKVRRCNSDSPIGDSIGLCYLQRSAISASNEVHLVIFVETHVFIVSSFAICCLIWCYINGWNNSCSKWLSSWF